MSLDQNTSVPVVDHKHLSVLHEATLQNLLKSSNRAVWHILHEREFMIEDWYVFIQLISSFPWFLYSLWQQHVRCTCWLSTGRNPAIELYVSPTIPSTLYHYQRRGCDPIHLQPSCGYQSSISMSSFSMS